MIKSLHTKYLIKYFFITILLTACSCASTKNVDYFKDIPADAQLAISSTTVFKEPTIQADDILAISILTIDPVTSMVINQLGSPSNTANLNGTQAATVTTPSGFLVDKNGEVDLPIVGMVKLAGLTTFQAKNLIKERAALLYNGLNVQVRFSNFKITVLGEVTRPSAYIVPNEKISVLDALGLAGDLTIYGKRETVLLIREENGQQKFVRLNLNSKQLFNSPYYYLKQNDLLYVETNKAKAATLNQARTQTLAIIGTALSVVAVLVARINF